MKETHPNTSSFPVNPRFALQAEMLPNMKSINAQMFVRSFEYLIEDMIKRDFPELNCDQFIEKLEAFLPLVTTTLPDKTPSCFSFCVLCYGKYTQGVGRFIPDMLSRWLIPGTQLRITGNRSLSCAFKTHPNTLFYATEYIIAADQPQHLHLIKKRLPSFINDVRLNILSVYHARHIVSKKQLSFEQKSLLIKKNIFHLTQKSHSSFDSNPYDHLQNFFIKLSAEKKLSEVEKNLSYLMHKKPKTFDKDIYNAVHNMLFLFKDSFTAVRDTRHISRIITFQYLFHKSISEAIYNAPEKRHISIKILKTRIKPNDQFVIGLLISLNFLHETERFNKNHILEAVWFCQQDVSLVKDSYLVDRRDEKIRSYYLEIKKNNQGNFSFDEIKNLKKRLPKELINRIENNLHPIFMPRNEEEVLRNIILLSKQLQYVRDIPQVIITYERQIGIHICFNVILVRLIKPPSQPLATLVANSTSQLQFTFEEVKRIAYLKKKYPKEANVFKVYLNKNRFFRHDHSLNLLKARQCVVDELTAIIGEFRDYNGGMIVKQTQALKELKTFFKKLSGKKEVLLENVFYSLRPVVMQSILLPLVIRQLFDLLFKTTQKASIKNNFFAQSESFHEYFLCCMISVSPQVKEEIFSLIKKLKIPSFELTHFSIELPKYLCFGFIYRVSDLAIKASLEKILSENYSSHLIKS